MLKFLKAFWLIGAVIFSFVSIVLAEDFTITTYYPSPYGSFDQLQTNRLAVGDTNTDDILDAEDQPNRDGDIRLRPQIGNPDNWPDRTVGQFAYSSMNDSLYHYNGSDWVRSKGGCYVSYTNSCLAGFTDMGDVGEWGSCDNSPGGTHWTFRPPSLAGAGCYIGWNAKKRGDAQVCCRN